MFVKDKVFHFQIDLKNIIFSENSNSVEMYLLHCIK